MKMFSRETRSANFSLREISLWRGAWFGAKNARKDFLPLDDCCEGWAAVKKINFDARLSHRPVELKTCLLFEIFKLVLLELSTNILSTLEAATSATRTNKETLSIL